MMNKLILINDIIEKLEEELKAAKSAALQTYAAATGEESRPENEYDTRALEASYLAGAQSKRVAEIEEALNLYKYLEPKSYQSSDPIGPCALIELDFEGKKSLVFLTPASGGLIVQSQGKTVQVLTPKSPLGEALLTLHTGDVAVVEKGSRALEYEIFSIS